MAFNVGGKRFQNGAYKRGFIRVVAGWNLGGHTQAELW